MQALLAGFLLVVGFASQDDADKKAAELLKKLEDQVMKAKTLHVEFEAAPVAAGREEKLKGELKIGEGGAFHYKLTINQGKGRSDEFLLRSDGSTIVGSVPRSQADFSKWKPEAVQRVLRRVANQATFLGIYLAVGKDIDPESAFDEFAPKDVKSEGKEKVGEVEATVVSFALELKDGPGKGMTIKLWIDPAKLTILKRFINMGRESLVETTSQFELNADFPAGFFEFQTAALLREGLAIQLARSVALHARYTGRLPKALADLTRRPADLPAAVFWPECGFWIGGAIPKDLPYASDAAHFTIGPIKEAIPGISPVAAPSDRLKKHFDARVRIQLLRAAAEGYHKATSMMPKDPHDLVKKPDQVRFWPEGGWIGGGSLPVDPWGEAFLIRAGASLSVTVAKAKSRFVKLSDLTPEERKALDDAAIPALSEKDAAEVNSHLGQLGAESVEDREKATKSIIAKGPGALRVVTERLVIEKDAEVAARLGLIRDHFRSIKSTWELELKGQKITLTGSSAGGGMMDMNERNGSRTLKTLTTAQADFRANDRDGNRINDFYARDVAGLYALNPATGKLTEAIAGKEGDPILKLIEPHTAMADATEDRWTYPVLKIQDPQPKSGYLFAALKNYVEGGKEIPYHKGTGRNNDRFGFIAYPADYGVSGKSTYIVNEDNTIWAKDLGGDEIDTFPADPRAEGWVKLD
jgi:outer membrane lipoprotein-sorting protein